MKGKIMVMVVTCGSSASRVEVVVSEKRRFSFFLIWDTWVGFLDIALDLASGVFEAFRFPTLGEDANDTLFFSWEFLCLIMIDWSSVEVRMCFQTGLHETNFVCLPRHLSRSSLSAI